MLQELQKRMKELHMVAPGDRILVGVSGGADSVCLFVALKELQKALDFSMEVVHVEHGIRGEESKADARFVADLCEKYGVNYQICEVDVPAFATEKGLGFEEAARLLRYEVFEKIAKEKDAKIALAHHKEDNAETILFQMVRGSSLAGLCGMQPVRTSESGVCYIRPLLAIHREQIETFLDQRGLTWCQDSTNVDMAYSRNFLRGSVIPQLEQINAQAVAHINQTAEHLSEVQEYIEFETEQLWKNIASVEAAMVLDAKKLLDLHPMMQRQIAYKAIVMAAKKKKDITSTHVADFLSLCKGQSGRRISLPYGVVAQKEFDKVRVLVCQEEFHEENVYELSQETLKELLESGREKRIPIGNAGEAIRCRVFEKNKETLEIPRKTYTKWLDYDKIKKGFCIRTRRSGDYFISDANGHHKKLKSYFIDEKIPLAEREKCWLLAQDNEVLWIIGGRIGENVKVLQETKCVFEITYDGGKENE